MPALPSLRSLGLALALLATPSASQAATLETLHQQLRQNYADMVFAEYSDSLAAARSLDERIKAFIKQPSEQGMSACRAAWIKARQPYLLTESFRFYGGPIDGADGLEGLLNAWPIDESWMEDATPNSTRGFIQNTVSYPNITAETLRTLNQTQGEKNICTGWHAVEFLLWGVDESDTGPGNRDWHDYTDGPLAKRRAAALQAASSLLIECLGNLVEQWEAAPASENYRAQFMAVAPLISTTRILTGLTLLSGSEMSDERMTVALETRDQENEQSCFSDTTDQDLRFNLAGLKSVWEGKYKSLYLAENEVQGTGLADVARAVDPTLTATIDKVFIKAEALAKALPHPFDQAIRCNDTAAERKALVEMRDTLEYLTSMFTALAGRMSVVLPTAPLDG